MPDSVTVMAELYAAGTVRFPVSSYAGAVSDCELRRRGRARVRAVGLLECLSLLAGALTLFDLLRGRATDHPWPFVVFVLLVSAAVRGLVLCEYVRFDDDGLHWRSLWRTRHAAWEHTIRLEVASMALFPARFGVQCIRARFTTGAVVWLRPSVSCGRHAIDEFIAAAREASPYAWREGSASR
jgi:hypothetical protein